MRGGTSSMVCQNTVNSFLLILNADGSLDAHNVLKGVVCQVNNSVINSGNREKRSLRPHVQHRSVPCSLSHHLSTSLECNASSYRQGAVSYMSFWITMSCSMRSSRAGCLLRKNLSAIVKGGCSDVSSGSLQGVVPTRYSIFA